MPLFVKAYGEEVLHGSYNIGFWFWELPSARSDWSHYYEYVDEIWVASEFCRTQTDDQLVAFIKVGRGADDPANTTKIAMPPKGGNPALKDEDLRAIVTYVRGLTAS